MITGLIPLVLFNSVGLVLWFIVIVRVCAGLGCLFCVCALLFIISDWAVCSLVTLLIIVALVFASGCCLC